MSDDIIMRCVLSGYASYGYKEGQTMKLLSIAVPCYNSAAYMSHAIESLLVGGDDVEILVVDDGSTDNTLEIARQYEEKYPSQVRAIHKENGGHGSAVNAGLANATGLYYKVVDSDDWVKKEAFLEALAVLRDMVNNSITLDMLISNYVYEKVGEKKKKVINYRTAFPRNEIFTWDEVGHFRTGRYLLMHSVIYRTKLLRDCRLHLPEHCFYVDNIYVYTPLPYVKTMYYLDVNLYRYFIGRSDQSVSESNMMKRIDQQLLVTRTMIEEYDLSTIKNRRLRAYMTKYLGIMMTISSVFLMKLGDEESTRKKNELWQFLKQKNRHLYNHISATFLGSASKAKSHTGQEIVKAGYVVANKLFKFN